MKHASLREFRVHKRYTSDRRTFSASIFQKKMIILRWTFFRKKSSKKWLNHLKTRRVYEISYRSFNFNRLNASIKPNNRVCS